MIADLCEYLIIQQDHLFRIRIVIFKRKQILYILKTSVLCSCFDYLKLIIDFTLVLRIMQEKQTATFFIQLLWLKKNNLQ